jgi:hypothetical protein
MLPHFPVNRLADGVQDVSLTRRPPVPLEKFVVLTSVKRLSRPQGHSLQGWDPSSDLPACSIVPAVHCALHKLANITPRFLGRQTESH